ncbi:MAG: hypothetical protein HWD58_16300 [Bacteroidota bacterium]|nr:MAG: hypothetical protein HWD58_16300 [Bacteroidota bacterium]
MKPQSMVEVYHIIGLSQTIFEIINLNGKDALYLQWYGRFLAITMILRGPNF